MANKKKSSVKSSVKSSARKSGHAKRSGSSNKSVIEIGLPVWAVILVISLVLVTVAVYYFIRTKDNSTKGGGAIPVGEFSAHVLMLGNKNNGDCIYVKAGDTDILIDGGSKATSAPTIKSYLSSYVTDGKLEFVIVTHADSDHIACFAGSNANPSLFREYECETIIDFPRTNKTTATSRATYDKYIEERDAEVAAGAKRYSALECYNEENGAQRVYDLGESLSMEVLYNYYYENDSNDENNYSVCVQFVHGERKFLFTGDLEEDGEKKLVENNNLSEVEFFKAGHHGSKTSSNDVLLNIIKPKICAVSCSAGYNQYHAAAENVFPTQAFVSRISKYTDKVYVTTLGDPDFVGDAGFLPMNGNIVVNSGEEVTVTCSAAATLLKDTAWFKANRTWA